MTGPATATRLQAYVIHGGLRFGSLAVDFVATALLMRALGPGPFGLVAMATTLMSILSTLGDAGVGQSLMTDAKGKAAATGSEDGSVATGARPHSTDERRATETSGAEGSPRPTKSRGDARRTGAAIAIGGALGAAVTLAGLLLTPLVLMLYGEPGVRAPWLVACALALPAVLLNVPLALAQKEERFALLAGSRLLATLVASLVALAMAQAQPDAWPLLARQALATLLQLVIVWVVLRPPVARPARADLDEVRGFARGFVGFQVLNAAQRNAHGPLIGRALGDDAVGHFGVAQRVLTTPIDQVGGLLGAVAYPRIARLAPDSQAVARAISALMREVATLTTPVCLGVAIAAPELVAVLFGPKWAPAVLPCQLLALLGAWQAPARYAGLAFTVLRDTQAMARWELVSAPVAIAGMALGLPWGVSGAALGYVLAALLLAVPQMRAAARVVGVPATTVARGALEGMATGAAATAPLLATYLAARALGAPPKVVLFATIGVGAISELLLVRAWYRSR